MHSKHSKENKKKMPAKWIVLRGRRYYYYETYNTYQEARRMADRYKRRNKKMRAFILPIESFWFPKIKYRLYLNKVSRLWEW